MSYDIEIIKKENYDISEWSGGKTTELSIYPKTAKYSERNFKWRISSATVDVEESIFTHLPGISRQLMIIEGSAVLEHEDRYKITLNPFEKDSFMGDWITKSYGKVSDFNLMTSEDCIGKLECLSIDTGESINVILNNDGKQGKITESFYAVNGNLELVLEKDKFDISEKDLFCINYSYSEKLPKIQIFNKYKDKIKIIRAVICYSNK